IDYQDAYVEPLIRSALKARLPHGSYVFFLSPAELTPDTPTLEWKQYESLSFPSILSHPQTFLANSYIIRKALIRKNFLAETVRYWVAKHPSSILASGIKPSLDLEVDYAEFLDEALYEAYELNESFTRNEHQQEKEWWILKPALTDGANGIRLFSSLDELRGIFEEWEESTSSSDDDDDDSEIVNSETGPQTNHTKGSEGIITSQLRHFTAQPYITPPLLFPQVGNRKFHIRTYVLAVGALKVYVYRHMLALFAQKEYITPTAQTEIDLRAHLTNTCFWKAGNKRSDTGENSTTLLAPDPAEKMVIPLSSLPPTHPTLGSWLPATLSQINTLTSELFRAAAQMTTNFQPLPNAFEIFGVDFLVDADGRVWLLEVNAFPDFRQSGEEAKWVVEGLLGGVVDVGVRPFFGLD
ncbi:tubulin-tyrosine ligase, partial [Piedraia hortae CBS 480.64]